MDQSSQCQCSLEGDTGAWHVVHEKLLRRMPANTVGIPEYLDLMWCNLVGHYLDGCDPAKQKGLPKGATNCLGRTSCSYSYITPLRHFNDGDLGKRNLTTRNTSATTHWLDNDLRFPLYSMMPTWRPAGTYLRRAPCWNTSSVQDALTNWTFNERQYATAARSSGKY